MELSYKVRGADGKEYGPATLAQVAAWLQEGRITRQTDMTRSDISYWAPVGNFTEIRGPAGPSGGSSVQSSGPAPANAASNPAAQSQLRSGASWFYWIAALSLVNSVVALSGKNSGFIIGLGITQVFDAIGRDLGSTGKAVVIVLDLLAASVFVLFGVFAHKRHAWAFIVGMILYAMDGLIYLVAGDWLAVGFHAFVLFCLFRGLQGCQQSRSA